MKRKNQKAFTLIELLIVIAIIAVLATVVVLSLNPAELLRQSRDSNRLSDMATYKSAISLYLADQSSPSLGASGTCYVSVATGTFAVPNSSSSPTWSGTATTSCALWMVTTITSASTTRGILGTNGWVPVNFNAISSGSPIGQEPIDPVNQVGTTTNCSYSGGSGNPSNCGLFYSYDESGGTTFKTAAFMESGKYSASSTGVEGTDGGNSINVYESGTNPAL
ncbi:MAG TPA: type II secretion system protein [Candidatus Paceibacterota bacterium]|jgi:prepilin-type N-terminal cleavage/methylation domain-containing protein|nr:type II secretion system protein [Candidatus Paceibacterota bacterium]